MNRSSAFLAVLLLGTVCGSAQWSAPRLVTSVNSAASEFDPSPSPNGLTLYFASDRSGNYDLFVASRPSAYSSFGPARSLTALNSLNTDAGPTVREDELEIFFFSSRGGGLGGHDLWRATRPNVTAPFSAPTNLTALNSTGEDSGPTVTADGLLIYFTSQRPGGLGGTDLWFSSRSSTTQPFGPPVRAVELNSSRWERDPEISADGLTIHFSSNRAGGAGRMDVYRAVRERRDQPFSGLVNVSQLNTSTDDFAPGTWRRGDELFVCTDQVRRGFYDLYVSRFVGLTTNGLAGPGRAVRLYYSAPNDVGRPYIAAASFGTSPGLPIGNRVVPLAASPLLWLTIGGLPPFFVGFAGVIGIDGTAQGAVIPPNDPRLIGVRLAVAFVVLDPRAPLGVQTISNARWIEVQ